MNFIRQTGQPQTILPVILSEIRKNTGYLVRVFKQAEQAAGSEKLKNNRKYGQPYL